MQCIFTSVSLKNFPLNDRWDKRALSEKKNNALSKAIGCVALIFEESYGKY